MSETPVLCSKCSSIVNSTTTALPPSHHFPFKSALPSSDLSTDAKPNKSHATQLPPIKPTKSRASQLPFIKSTKSHATQLPPIKPTKSRASQLPFIKSTKSHATQHLPPITPTSTCFSTSMYQVPPSPPGLLQTFIHQVHQVTCYSTFIHQVHQVTCYSTFIHQVHQVTCYSTFIHQVHQVTCYSTFIQQLHQVTPTFIHQVHQVTCYSTFIRNSPNDVRDNRVLNLSTISMGHEILRSVSKIWPEIYIIVLIVVSVQQFNMMGFLG